MTERFGQIVIRSELQAAYPVALGAERGEHQDGDTGPLRAKVLQQVASVRLTQVYVENDQV